MALPIFRLGCIVYAIVRQDGVASDLPPNVDFNLSRLKFTPETPRHSGLKMVSEVSYQRKKSGHGAQNSVSVESATEFWGGTSFVRVDINFRYVNYISSVDIYCGFGRVRGKPEK
ncbi:hypothetical protein [Shimia sagamensis]|uniref:hypothetical protein n=1 Tax=Shimia sagamensis TaxID=1566352 RepID=UPI0024B7E8AF|nr:hypothetical protein [Shimia sagamensis]